MCTLLLEIYIDGLDGACEGVDQGYTDVVEALLQHPDIDVNIASNVIYEYQLFQING